MLMSSSHKWENHENNNDFIARLAEKLMHDTLNIGKTGALPVTGTNFFRRCCGSESHPGRNPTMGEAGNICEMTGSTAKILQALTATPFVLVASTPLD
jgi:hypothetical protein